MTIVLNRLTPTSEVGAGFFKKARKSNCELDLISAPPNSENFDTSAV